MPSKSDPLASLGSLHHLSVFEALAEGITIADETGRILYSNSAADRILGTGATDADPDGWADHYGVFIPGTDEAFPTEAYPLIRAVAGEETNDVEMVIRNGAVPEGALISVSGRPVRSSDGTVRGAVVVFRDITALRAAQTDLRRALRDLQEIQTQKSELLGFLVHDMKGPLTAILATVDLVLTGGASEEEVQDDLLQIRVSANALHRMVLNLLDVQTAEDGRLEPHIQEVDLRKLFEETAGRARVRGAQVTIEQPEEITLAADEELLERVLGNLMDNCIKYGPDGGRIWFNGSVDHQAGRVRISVRDEGPGVPVELREKIFERYAKVERDAGRRQAGSRGLGLRFCKVAVEAHGGTIWVEDAEPRGAKFCVELPHGRS